VRCSAKRAAKAKQLNNAMQRGVLQLPASENPRAGARALRVAWGRRAARALCARRAPARTRGGAIIADARANAGVCCFPPPARLIDPVIATLFLIFLFVNNESLISRLVSVFCPWCGSCAWLRIFTYVTQTIGVSGLLYWRHGHSLWLCYLHGSRGGQILISRKEDLGGHADKEPNVSPTATPVCSPDAVVVPLSRLLVCCLWEACTHTPNTP